MALEDAREVVAPPNDHAVAPPAAAKEQPATSATSTDDAPPPTTRAPGRALEPQLQEWIRGKRLRGWSYERIAKAGGVSVKAATKYASDVTPPTPAIRRSSRLTPTTVGGWIGDAFAARHAEEVAGLVLIDATPFTEFEGLDEPRATLQDGDEGGAVFDWKACLAELQERKPDPSLTRTLVLSSALDRWLRNEPLDWHRPFTLEQVEARWRLMQAEWSTRLHAPRVVADTGGHLVHNEQPELAAAVVGAVVAAVRAGEQLNLDPGLVAAAGGKML